MLKYLLDENVDPVYKSQLLRYDPNLIILVVGETDAPPKGTLDPEILCWCETYGFVLIINNRASMPVHLAEHIMQNHHIPGILILDPDGSIGENIEELLLIAEASFTNEYQDRIEYLPLR